jgi:hypothetical protein
VLSAGRSAGLGMLFSNRLRERPRTHNGDTGLSDHLGVWTPPKCLRCGALLLCAPLILLAGCGGGASNQPVISGHDLAGMWTTGKAWMSFSSDHAIVVHKVNVEPGDPGCGVVSGTGTWQFLSSKGVSAAAPDLYKRGSLIEVELTVAPEVCGSWGLTTWGSPSAVTLCVESDPDSPCISDTFRRRS